MGQELVRSTLKKKKPPPTPPNSLPQPLRREGSADKRGLRIDVKSVSSYFIGYNLILRRSLPLPLRREGSADKKRDEDR